MQVLLISGISFFQSGAGYLGAIIRGFGLLRKRGFGSLKLLLLWEPTGTL